MTTSPWKVTVFGAGGALGRRVLPLLRKAGCETTAFVRGSADRLPPASRAAVDRVVVGDAFLDREAVQEACADADAVVSMLTPRPPSLRLTSHAPPARAGARWSPSGRWSPAAIAHVIGAGPARVPCIAAGPCAAVGAREIEKIKEICVLTLQV